MQYNIIVYIVTMVIELIVVHTCMHALKTMNLYAKFQINMILPSIKHQIYKYFLLFFQLLTRSVAIVLVGIVANPYILIALVVLLIGFLFIRWYYLKTARDIKRLEALGKLMYVYNLFVLSNNCIHASCILLAQYSPYVHGRGVEIVSQLLDILAYFSSFLSCSSYTLYTTQF